MAKFLTRVAVYALMERDGRLLMLQRANSGYHDGDYSLPAGHVEEGETPTQAMVREIREEVGVDVDPADLAFAHVMHRQYGQTYNDYYFTCRGWRGELRNMEPDKCSDMQWFALESLPDNVVPEVKQALECVTRGEKFSELDLR